MAIPRLSKGDDLIIQAAEWNRHCDVSDWFHRQRQRGESAGQSQNASDSNVVVVRNDSPANRREGEILEFNGIVPADLSDGLLWMTGGAPAITNGWGLLLQPIPKDAPDNFGNCVIAGKARALVNVISASHQYASPKKDSYVLQSCFGGPVRILFKPTGTGEKTCAVLLTGDSTGLVKPVSDIAQGDQGDCKVWLNNADTGATVSLTALLDVTGGTLCTQWCQFVLPAECS